MQDYLRPRDLCEEHVLEAVTALTKVLGASLVPLRDRVAAQAERREHLAQAARAIAAAQAANEGGARQIQRLATNVMLLLIFDVAVYD